MTREEAKEVLIIKAGLGGFVENIIDQIYNDHEAQLKAKDEEIERLKDQLSSVHNIMYRNGYSDAIDCYDTFGNFNTRHKPNTKARSIVAMLFWNYKHNLFAFDVEATVIVESKRIFEKAYKMLKMV